MSLGPPRQYSRIQKEIIQFQYMLQKRGIRMGHRKISVVKYIDNGLWLKEPDLKKKSRRLWWIKYNSNDTLHTEYFLSLWRARDRATNLAKILPEKKYGLV